MWISRILGPIKFCKGPIKISNGPLEFGNLHVFEWDMGHWSILRAHHHFGLGLSLALELHDMASKNAAAFYTQPLYKVLSVKNTLHANFHFNGHQYICVYVLQLFIHALFLYTVKTCPDMTEKLLTET